MLVAMKRNPGLMLRLAWKFRGVIRLFRRVAPALLILAAILPMAITGDAFAQADNPVAPPEPGDIRGGFKVWIAYLALIALTAVVLVVGLFPSKRGHQD